jgi:hypothetical protein
MPQVVCPRRTIYQEVVEENKCELPDEGLHDVIHESLESGWCIVKAKWHYKKLEMTTMCPESYLVDVAGMHSDLMISTANIKLGEEACVGICAGETTLQVAGEFLPPR